MVNSTRSASISCRIPVSCPGPHPRPRAATARALLCGGTALCFPWGTPSGVKAAGCSRRGWMGTGWDRSKALRCICLLMVSSGRHPAASGRICLLQARPGEVGWARWHSCYRRRRIRPRGRGVAGWEADGRQGTASLSACYAPWACGGLVPMGIVGAGGATQRGLGVADPAGRV